MVTYVLFPRVARTVKVEERYQNLLNSIMRKSDRMILEHNLTLKELKRINRFIITVKSLDTETNIFYGVYYYVTFNHFLHVGWGTAGLVWVIYRINTGIYTKTEHEGLINMALYWRMIDLAWITIFPLLYVIR